MLMEKRFGVKGNSDPKKDWRAFRQKNETENESSHFPNSPRRTNKGSATFCFVQD